MIAREGDPVGFFAGATWSELFSNPVLTDTSVVGFEAGSIAGVVGGTANDDVLVLGATAIVQEGITVPSGQAGGAQMPWASFAPDGFFVSPNGLRKIVLGEVGASGGTQLVSVDGIAVVEQGVALAPLVDPVAVIDRVRMDDGAAWFASGSNGGTGVDWVVRNGFLVAVSNQAVPIVPGALETWADTVFSPAFFGFDGDASGAFVVAGTTDAVDLEANAVVVLTNTSGARVLAREGDPIDLDGDGAFDDERWIDTFASGSIRMGGGFCWFVCSLRDGRGVPRDSAVVRVPVDAPLARFTFSEVPNTSGLTLQFRDTSAWDALITGWEWDFDGDGTVDSTARNPAHRFPGPGTYLVGLTVRASGVAGRTEVPIEVARLAADFSATPRAGTLPLVVRFSDRSAGSPTSWAWDFDGDGTTDSMAPNPQFTYSVPGTYDVRLTVTDAVGSDTRTEVGFITVEPVAASFGVSATTGFEPLTVSFVDTSTGAPTAWAWDFDGDGTTDSTARNPSFTYTAGGVYSVSLTASNALSSSTLTEADRIVVLPPTINSASAELLSYSFNEPRGAFATNTASSSLAPEFGAVQLGDGWQGDPGRIAFRANEAGFGMMRQRAGDSVDTGWPLRLNTSYTIMWWQRLQQAAGNPYAFGSSGLRGMRCWSTNGRWSFRGAAVGTFDTQSRPNDPSNVGRWLHCALVVDAANGVASWYLDGQLDATRAFSGPVRESEPAFVIGALAPGSSSSAFDAMDMDDFRLYARALGPIDIATAMIHEDPSISHFGQACSGFATELRVDANLPPRLGENGFALEFTGIAPGTAAVCNLGVLARSLDFSGTVPLPLTIDALLPGAARGCRIENSALIPIALTPDATGGASLSLPVPTSPMLIGAHLYAQAISVGSGEAQVSQSLDANVQN